MSGDAQPGNCTRYRLSRSLVRFSLLIRTIRPRELGIVKRMEAERKSGDDHRRYRRDSTRRNGA